jgi:uncharacterized protein (DUF1015 family)
MGKIIPFRGVVYNPEKIKNFASVVTPPFDVISEEDQQKAYDSHPQSIIRLILGKKTENDTSKNNPFTRAAQFFSEWLAKDILVQDQAASFYLTSVEFLFENKPIIRWGFISLVGLEAFEKGIVIPHERTFSKVKSERLELIKACRANFSPIFSMYSDPQNEILDLLKDAVSGKRPDIDFVDNNEQHHKLWRITDVNIHRHVAEAMKAKKIFIADGHHRYETALNYRNWLQKNVTDFSLDHPANNVMMYLSSMEDPGMIILPAHRMLNEVPAVDRVALIQKAVDFFDIVKIPFENDVRENARIEFISRLRSNMSRTNIGIFMKDQPEFYLLKLKPDVMARIFEDEVPESLRDLDVTVLTRLIFMKILGFDQARLDNEKLIAYASDDQKAIEAVSAGKHDITFILNPTKIEQVRRIAEDGWVMPRKGTYFYPKVITGLVINKLS